MSFTQKAQSQCVVLSLALSACGEKITQPSEAPPPAPVSSEEDPVNAGPAPVDPPADSPADGIGPKPPLDLSQVPSCRTGFRNNEHIRRSPPPMFLMELFDFIAKSCKESELYSWNDERRDIFKHLKRDLRLSDDADLIDRCAAMFELLRVSAAMESSYNWKQGRDRSADNTSPQTMEAGIFQTSANSHVYAHKGYWGRWSYLDKLVRKYGVEPRNYWAWQWLQKSTDHKHFIFEHHAFLIRHNYRHYGPMIDRRRVGMNISNDCIEEVVEQLAN